VCPKGATGNAATNAHDCVGSAGDCPGHACYAFDYEDRGQGQVRGGTCEARCAIDAGEARCVSSTNGEASCVHGARDAGTRNTGTREARTIHGDDKARGACDYETGYTCADDKARDAPGTNGSETSDAARAGKESGARSHHAQGAAEIDESDRPHDEADAEEPGG